MARRAQRANRQKGGAEYADAAPALPASAAESPAEEHLVAVQAADESLGFRLADVAEIIRVPRLAYMPLGPRSLLGLANLRGLVVPVVSLRRLLGFPEAPVDEAARVVVIAGGAPAGLVVDRVDALLTVPGAGIETDRVGAGRLDPDLLVGVVKRGEGEGTIKIVDPARLLRAEFGHMGERSARATASIAAAAEPRGPATEPQGLTSLVSFELGRQEYALPLDRVREIIPLPEHVSELAGSETAVLGVVTLRDRLLPLVSLRAILGLPGQEERTAPGKVVVVSLGKGAVGVVADRTREILRVDPAFIDPAPALLTRGAGEAEIESICRLDNGRRLVAVLSPDRLFRSDLVRRVLSEAGNDNVDAGAETAGNAMSDEQFIIFRLGDQEYGLPITTVDEVVRVPEQVTRLPKAPGFIDGVINLRGRVVPIVDLRRRFELDAREAAASRRILVLAIGGVQTGFMVDAVSEVLKVSADAVRPAPDLSPEQMRLIGRVANLEAQGRMILLVDPAQLLDQVEADVLAKFDRIRSAQAMNAS